MSIVTSQQLTRYYDSFKAIDATFTKELIQATGLQTQQVFLKCVGDQWPCVIYSTSFISAKIIASTKTGLIEKLKKSNNAASLRFAFKIADKEEPRAFFVGTKVAGFAPYQGSQDLSFITLLYTQRPPDDLIEILGKLLEANVNSRRRGEERILVTADSIRKLRLVSKETMVYVQGVPRRAILRDISFSGAKIIMIGIAKFLSDKDCMVRIELDDPRETVEIPGRILRGEEVEGRRDLAAVAIRFIDGAVPMSFKLHINEYLQQTRKQEPENPPPEPPKKSDAAAASADGASKPSGANPAVKPPAPQTAKPAAGANPAAKPSAPAPQAGANPQTPRS